MTDEQINIAIAEACGYYYMDSVWHYPNGAKADKLPDYLNCLNAMHEAVLTLSNTKFHRWVQELSLLLTGTKHKAPTRGFLCATARQRAEAFLKTIKKWEEQTND